MKRILFVCLVLALFAGMAQAGVEYDTVRATTHLYVGSRYDTTPALDVSTADQTFNIALSPGSSTRYLMSWVLAPSRAAGGSGLYLNATQTTNAMTSGSMQALDVVANMGTSACTGTLRGAQIKARQPDAGITGTLEAIYCSADQKDQTCTNLRGVEISLDGEAGGVATTSQGVVVYGNSSGDLGTSIAYDVNDGSVSGHNTFTYDFRFQNGEYITNSTDGLLDAGGARWTLAPVRGTDTYAYGYKIDTDVFFDGGAAEKDYLLYVGGDKEVEHAATGDSNSAYIRVSGNNYAANDTNYIMRGVNVGINNRSGGTMGRLEAGAFGAQGKSGGTINNIFGLTIVPENYGTVSDAFIGIDVLLKNEGTVATTEAGVRIRNENNSVADAVGAAILVTDTGANTGFDYIIDANGASNAVVADFRLTNGITISSGSGSPDGSITAPQGSLYVDTAGAADAQLWINEAGGTAWCKVDTST